MTISAATQARIESDVQQLVHLQEVAAQLADQIETIKDRLRSAIPAGTSVPVAGVTVTVSAPIRRWNDDQARATLTAEQLTMITEPTLSSALARKLLPPVVYEACQKPSGEPRLTIKG